MSTKVTLRCAARDLGNPVGRMQWSKDGIQLGTGAELIIPSVTLNDDGSYTCTAVNTIGSGVSASTKLTVFR